MDRLLSRTEFSRRTAPRALAASRDGGRMALAVHGMLLVLSVTLFALAARYAPLPHVSAQAPTFLNSR